MKVSFQSLGIRTTIRPKTAFAAVAVSLLSLAGACGNSGSNGTGAAPFTTTPTNPAGTPSGVAGTPTTPVAATAGTIAAPSIVAGTAAPTGVTAAGSGATVATATAAGTVAVATGGTGTAAAAGAGAAAPSVSATFTAVLAVLADSKNNCGTCHKSAMIGGGLMFDPTDKAATYTALVGPKSAGMYGSTCGGKTYVVPGKPEDSLLYDKVSKAMPVCGLRMPASGIILDDPEIATIKAWIMAGAPNN